MPQLGREKVKGFFIVFSWNESVLVFFLKKDLKLAPIQGEGERETEERGRSPQTGGCQI